MARLTSQGLPHGSVRQGPQTAGLWSQPAPFLNARPSACPLPSGERGPTLYCHSASDQCPSWEPRQPSGLRWGLGGPERGGQSHRRFRLQGEGLELTLMRTPPHPGPSASPTCASHTRSNHLHPRRQDHRFLPELASSLDRFPSQGFVPETQLLQPMTPLNRAPQSFSPSTVVPFRGRQRDSSLGNEGQATGLLHLAS